MCVCVCLQLNILGVQAAGCVCVCLKVSIPGVQAAGCVCVCAYVCAWPEAIKGGGRRVESPDLSWRVWEKWGSG